MVNGLQTHEWQLTGTFVLRHTSYVSLTGLLSYPRCLKAASAELNTQHELMHCRTSKVTSDMREVVER